MTNTPFSASYIHHVALRVENAQETKDWYVAMLDLRVAREFDYNGLQFIWLSTGSADEPFIELVGGLSVDPIRIHASNADMLREPGFHHVCLHVRSVDDVMSHLKSRGATVVLDVVAGALGSGVRKAAFISDPWGNVLEFLEMETDKATNAA